MDTCTPSAWNCVILRATAENHACVAIPRRNRARAKARTHKYAAAIGVSAADAVEINGAYARARTPRVSTRTYCECGLTQSFSQMQLND